MIKAIRTVAAIAVLGGFCAAAQAITVDFNDLTTATPGASKAGTGGSTSGGSVYVGGGLTFTSDSDLQVWGSGDAENAGAPFATLYKSEVPPVAPALQVTRTIGGKFDLVSLQLAEADNSAAGAAVTFRYTNDSGTFSQILTIPAASGLHTFVLNQSGLTSFSLGEVDYQLDNVVYLPAVPEPSAWALMGAGFLGLGALRRRSGGAGPA